MYTLIQNLRNFLIHPSIRVPLTKSSELVVVLFRTTPTSPYYKVYIQFHTTTPFYPQSITVQRTTTYYSVPQSNSIPYYNSVYYKALQRTTRY